MKQELEKRDLMKYFEQHKPIFNYYQTDFVSEKYKIIIECDGDYWHSLPKVKNRDLIKNELANKNNYYMLRFWEHEINQDIEGCINFIEFVMQKVVV